eukprot:Rhum_TRINITY_DN15089_c3_g1::Rhum_TRINITY_DN15089_c3_g1_i1::g.136605::m.136605
MPTTGSPPSRGALDGVLEARRGAPPPPLPAAKRARLASDGVADAPAPTAERLNDWQRIDPSRWTQVVDDFFFINLKAAVKRLYPFSSAALKPERRDFIQKIEAWARSCPCHAAGCRRVLEYPMQAVLPAAKHLAGLG